MSVRYTQLAEQMIESLSAVVDAAVSTGDVGGALSTARHKANEAFSCAVTLLVLLDEYADRQFLSTALQDARHTLEAIPAWGAEEWGDYHRADVGRNASSAIVTLRMYIAKG